MEAVSSRVTEAHDTLTEKSKRAEYDAYLGAQDESRAIEAKLGRTSSPGMDRTERPMVTPPPGDHALSPTGARPSGIQGLRAGPA